MRKQCLWYVPYMREMSPGTYTQIFSNKPWPNGLASRRKSMQVCKTRTCVRTCEGWPNRFASQLASQKWRKFHAYHWLMHFYNNRLLAISLCRLVLGGQTLKNLRPNLSSTKVNTSRRKWMQVGGQTKRKLNASPNLALTCESVWPGL